MKKPLLCITMALSIMATTGTSALASNDLNVSVTDECTLPNPNSIYATTIDELTIMSREDINALSLLEIDDYFETSFGVSAKNYLYDEKLSALEAVSVVGQFQEQSQLLRSSSTTTNLNCYSGAKGVAWVRDTTSSGSPLTLSEAFSGVYTLEVDYLTYYEAAAIYALGSDYNFYKSVVNAASTTIASNYICKYLNISTETVFLSSVISFGVGLGWDILSSLDRSAMSKALQNMDNASSLMRVDFLTSNNYVYRCYEAVNLPNVTWLPSVNYYKYTNIPNPTGKYGFWYTDTIGKLYKFG